MERNIANIMEIDNFIDMLTQKAVGREDIKLWLGGNFRNYLLRTYPEISVVEKPVPGDPPWVWRDFARGRKIQQVKLDYQLQDHLSHVIDFFFANPRLRLQRLSVPDAIRLTSRWEEEMERQAEAGETPLEDDGDEAGIFPVVLYDNGYRWVELIAPSSLNREGRLMKNCIGSYTGRKNTHVYSLRDRLNLPHITLSITGWPRKLSEAKGKANRRLDAGSEYSKYLLHFIISQELECEGCWDLQGVAIATHRGFIEKQFFWQYLKADKRRIMAWLGRPRKVEKAAASLSLGLGSLWDDLISLARELAGKEGTTVDGPLFASLGYSWKEAGRLIFLTDNLGGLHYKRMLKDVFGINEIGEIGRVLPDELLARLPMEAAFCHYCQNNWTEDSLLTLLGIDVDDLGRLRSLNPDVIQLAEPDEIKPEWYADLQDMERYVRSKFSWVSCGIMEIYHPRIVSFGKKLRKYIQSQGHSTAEIRELCQKVRHLLFCIEPNPAAISVEYFRSSGGGRLLGEYINDAYYRKNEDVVQNARRIGSFLAELAFDDQEYDQLLSGLKALQAQKIMIGRHYPTSREVEGDLRLLGVSSSSVLLEHYRQTGVLAEEMKAAAEFFGDLPKYLLQAACIGKWYYGCWTARLRDFNILGKWLVVEYLFSQWVLAKRREEKRAEALPVDLRRRPVIYAQEPRWLLLDDVFRFLGSEGIAAKKLTDMFDGKIVSREIASVVRLAGSYSAEAILQPFTNRRRKDIEDFLDYNWDADDLEQAVNLAQRYCRYMASLLNNAAPVKFRSDEFWLDEPLGCLWERITPAERSRLSQLWQDVSSRDPTEVAAGLADESPEVQFAVLKILPYELRDRICLILLEREQSRWERTPRRERGTSSRQLNFAGSLAVFCEGYSHYCRIMEFSTRKKGDGQEKACYRRQDDEPCDPATCQSASHTDTHPQTRLESIVQALREERRKQRTLIKAYQPRLIHKMKVAEIREEIRQYSEKTLQEFCRETGLGE